MKKHTHVELTPTGPARRPTWGTVPHDPNGMPPMDSPPKVVPDPLTDMARAITAKEVVMSATNGMRRLLSGRLLMMEQMIQTQERLDTNQHTRLVTMVDALKREHEHHEALTRALDDEITTITAAMNILAESLTPNTHA